MWGPTIPELTAVIDDSQIIDRSMVNAWDDKRIRQAVSATGATKLIIAGVSVEVCAAFPAISAIGDGYDTYVAVDASGTFNATKRPVYYGCKPPVSWSPTTPHHSSRS